MKTLLAHPTLAALISALLCLPFVALFSLVLLDIEPDFGPLHPILTAPDSRLDSIIVFGFMLLLPVAFLVNLASIRRSLRAGERLEAHPLNLAVGAAILILILWLAGSFIVDQYPCWVGVPNCD